MWGLFVKFVIRVFEVGCVDGWFSFEVVVWLVCGGCLIVFDFLGLFVVFVEVEKMCCGGKVSVLF